MADQQQLNIAEAAALAQKAAAELPPTDYIKLFIGQLPKTYSEELLRPIFEPFGEIHEFTIIRDKVTGAHRGCAFLTYTSKTAADNAIAALHNTRTFKEMTHPLQVKYADGEVDKLEHKLFVGMISKTTTEEDLRTLFGPYGNVQEVFILHDTSGQSKGCGFVRYDTRDQAVAAISALNGTHYMQGCSTPMVVKFADNPKRNARQNKAPFQSAGPVGGAGLYGSAGAASTASGYGPYGAAALLNPYLAASYYQQASAAGAPAASSSAGIFADMAKLPPAAAAAALQQYSALYSAYAGAAANPAAAALPSALTTASSSSQSEGPPGANLFLYHLPNEFGDRDLYVNFSPFGNILSTKVFIDKNTGQSKCFGFVSYDNPESAQAAIAAMNGLQIGGKRLKVQLKKDGGGGGSGNRSGPY